MRLGTDENAPLRMGRSYRGFYGCTSATENRLVRLDWHGPAPRFGPKRHHALDCPVCRNHHRVEVWWRRLREEDPEGELVVG